MILGDVSGLSRLIECHKYSENITRIFEFTFNIELFEEYERLPRLKLKRQKLSGRSTTRENRRTCRSANWI